MLENLTLYMTYSQLNIIVNKCKNDSDDTACFIFNCDESGFSLDPKRMKAIGEKGKPLIRVSGGSGRESVSVLATVSADGYHFPPFIVFKGAAVQSRWAHSTLPHQTGRWKNQHFMNGLTNVLSNMLKI